MNNKKLSFEELFKKLQQCSWTLESLISSMFLYLSGMGLIFFMFLFPNIDLNDLFLFFLVVLGVFSATLIPVIRLNKKGNRIVYLRRSIIEAIIENVSDMDLFKNEKEKTILEENLKSLYLFQEIHEYKYSMIAMGSKLEFLLKRFCKKNKIDPEPYHLPNGGTIPGSKKQLCNYIQSAIKHDILGQKNSWYLIQNNLRNFRNYVHISKEIKEEEIDHDWFIATKGVFDRIIRNFKLKKE